MPEIAAEHILKRMSHHDQKNRMPNTLKLNRDKTVKKDFKKFVKELAREAKPIDRINAVKRFQATMSDSDDEFIKSFHYKPRQKGKSKGKGKCGKQKDKSPSDTERSEKDKKAGKSKDSGRNKRKRDLPECLNPKCNGQHFITDYPITSDGEARKFKTEYPDKERSRQDNKGGSSNGHKNDGNVRQISNGNLRRNTSPFSGTFCDGAVDTFILADKGVDGNAIAPSTLSSIQRANPNIRVNVLMRAYIFGNASPTATPITCRTWIQAY